MYLNCRKNAGSKNPRISKFTNGKTMLLLLPRGNAFEIASNPRNDGCQHGLASTVYKFFDEKTGDASTHGRDGIIAEDQQLANK